VKKKIIVLRPWRSFLPGIGSARSPPMKNNDNIHSTDTNEIKHLINRVKQGELDQGDALLIEKLLSILLTIVSLLERKHTSIQRMKELLFGMKEKKRGKDEDKNRAEDGWPGADGSSQTDSPNEMNSTCEDVRRLKRPGHGRMAASDYPGARLASTRRRGISKRGSHGIISTSSTTSRQSVCSQVSSPSHRSS
jgi:hypothetical protein